MRTAAARQALPSALTASRMLLAIWCFTLITSQDWGLATLVFLTGLLTDYLDGALARRLNVATKFGENVLEPLADGALVWLALYGLIRTEAVLAYGLIVGLAAYGLFILLVRSQTAHRFRKAFEPTADGVAVFGVALTLAINAGWPWMIMAIIFFCLASIFKRDRIRHHLSAWNRLRPTSD